MAVTLKDIAQKANVSISTVSRIINNDTSKPASPETQKRVWKIVRELGYVPNKNARNLVKSTGDLQRQSNTKAIGCIFTSDSYDDPFFSHIAKGIQEETSKRGYIMGYSFSSCDMTHSALYNNITSNKVDGAVILGRFNKDFLDFLKKNINHLVYAGINYVGGGFDEVICDGFKCAVHAVEHLISLGHHDIGYIGSIPNTKIVDVLNEHRFEGYKYTMEQHGFTINKDFVKNIRLSTQEGYKAMEELLERSKLPTAVFCANDSVAIGAMKAVHERGLYIPKDISIVGIDDIEMSEYVRPALTTIHIPKDELGKFAVKLLIDKIEGGHDFPVRMDLPFNLVMRESTTKIK